MDFDLDGVRYKARRMNALDQMEVLSKLMPLFVAGVGEVIPILNVVREQGLASILDLPLEQTVVKFVPVAQEFAKLPAADRNNILRLCLCQVEREIASGQAEQWAPVWPAGAPMPMQPDIRDDAFLMARIAFAVIRGTFADRFFAMSPSSSADAGQRQTSRR